MIQLFRVAGIPVRVDFGWLLIFGLISWSLASGYFPRVLPEQSTAAYWANGVVAAALLFVSVFLHELSHALVALAHGVRVSGIRLHVFGGVSEMESEPPTPRGELLIAIVGPLTSFAIAGLVWAVAAALALPTWAEALTAYLATVNLVVGAFNLVPGFPLDGGRVLRAGLWAWTGQLGRATRWASRTGSAFALLLMVFGVARTLGGDVIGGLWFILIGLFLHQAAQSSHELMRVRARLEPLRVQEVMTGTPVTVDAETPVATVLEDVFARHRVAGFPITRGEGRLVGFVTWSMVERRGRQANGATAAQVMEPAGADHVVAPLDSAWLAFLKISRNRLGRVAVVDGGRVVGIVSHRDLQHVLAVEGLKAELERRAA